MGAILGLLANAGVNLVEKFVGAGEDKAIKVIKDKTGIDLSKKQNLSQDDVVKLKEFENKNKDFLLKETQLFLNDKQNARSMRVKTLTSDKTPLFSKIFPDVLAGVSVIATFTLFYMFASGDVPKEQKDVVLYILGLLSGIVSTIYAFYYGSSKGSQDKDKHIQGIVK